MERKHRKRKQDFFEKKKKVECDDLSVWRELYNEMEKFLLSV